MSAQGPAQSAEDVAPVPPEMWFTREVADLRKLALNWNSYGSLPITEMAIRTVCSQRLVPHADGGITVTWARGLDEVEIGFGPDGSIEFVLWEKRKPAQIDGGKADD